MRTIRRRIRDIARAEPVCQVIQCACGRASMWRGEEHAIAKGWLGRYKRDADGWAILERIWFCPNCWPKPKSVDGVQTKG